MLIIKIIIIIIIIIAIIYTIILLMSVCQCSQNAGRNSCSIASVDVSEARRTY